MKKVFSFILVLALMMSLAVPAFAAAVTTAETDTPVGSVAAEEEDLVPKVGSSTCHLFRIYNKNEFGELSEEMQLLLEEAMKNLPDVVPENMLVRYFFDVALCAACESASADFVPQHGWVPIVIQYVNGEWEKREVVVNADGTITVHGLVNGPTAFLIEQTPVVVSSEDDQMKLHTAAQVDEEMDRSERKNMKAAEEKLPDVCPEGKLVRVFYHVELGEGAEETTAAFRLGDHHDLTVMQYVDGKWTEQEFTLNEEEGTVAVEGVVAGPMVIFVK